MTTLIRLLPSGECLVAPTGDIDLAVAPDLVAEFEYAMDHVSIDLIVDLSDVTFIDSSGLAALIRVRTTTQARGGSLMLVGLDESVSDLLRLTKLDHYFKIRRGAPGQFGY